MNNVVYNHLNSTSIERLRNKNRQIIRIFQFLIRFSLHILKHQKNSYSHVSNYSSLRNCIVFDDVTYAFYKRRKKVLKNLD